MGYHRTQQGRLCLRARLEPRRKVPLTEGGRGFNPRTKPPESTRALQSVEKRIQCCKKRQGTTSQAAEKLLRAVGRGFNPGINPPTRFKKSTHVAKPRCSFVAKSRGFTLRQTCHNTNVPTQFPAGRDFLYPPNADDVNLALRKIYQLRGGVGLPQEDA